MLYIIERFLEILYKIILINNTFSFKKFNTLVVDHFLKRNNKNKKKKKRKR
jgi:hypothetical protein